MLDRLPEEILYRCLSYLDLTEKLKCVLVNKTWCQKIRPVNLYATIHIISDKEKFKTVLEFFKKHKDDGKQVKDLKLVGCEVNFKTYISLPSIFPNVKTFFISDDVFTALPSSEWNKKEAIDGFKPWKDKIERMTELGAPICTFALLNRTHCEKLVYLYLGIWGAATSEAEKNKFIAKLKHAPYLTYLHLVGIKLTMKGMEKMFDAVPLLKTLACSDCMFARDGIVDSSETVKEPSQLETLFIAGGGFQDLYLPAINNWLNYFGLKFVHMKTLVYNETEDSAYGAIYDEFLKPGEYFLSRLTKLEFLRMRAFELDVKVWRAMDRGGVRLKRLDIGGYETSKEYKSLFRSIKQKESIESISSTGECFHDIVYNNFKKSSSMFLEKLSKFSNLKHLRILQSQSDVSTPNDIPFDELIQYLPNLESLEMDFGKLVIEYDSDEPLPNTKLKKLRLIEFEIYAKNKFKQQQKEEKEIKALSEDYLKEILPNTEIMMEELNIFIDQEPFKHIVDISSDDLN